MSGQPPPEELLARAKDHLAALAEARPRRRVDQACTECSKHHRKCERKEGQIACNRCLKNGVPCIFTARNTTSQTIDTSERDSETSVSPRSPTFSYSTTTSSHVHAHPPQSNYAQSPVYEYSAYSPSHPIPSSSEIDPHHPYSSQTLVSPPYPPPNPHTQYPYQNNSHSNVQNNYPQWQGRDPMQQGSLSQASSYTGSSMYAAPPAPSQQPTQPYANVWNPASSSQYTPQPPQVCHPAYSQFSYGLTL